MLLLVATCSPRRPPPSRPATCRSINPKAHQPATCPATSRYEASRRGKTPQGAASSTSCPTPTPISAVYRRIGGCEAPIIVDIGVGGR